MLRFNDIVDRMLEDQPEVDIGLLQRAYVFSAKVHEGQERLSGEPYLVHPLEVAGILVDLHVDDVTVVAGLLHDTLEDTLTTREELERLFGERVAFIVEGLTKIAKIEFSSVRERQAENFRKMLIAMSKDIRILLIKLADRLHNMRTLGHMGEDSARRIAQETLDIYVPLAHRLGIQSMKAELEDLAFRALRPEAAAELEAQIAGKRSERETYIEEVIGVLSAKFAQAGLHAEMTGRVKDLASVHAKMESQSLALDEIYDVIAFRVILDGGVEACYHALGIVHMTWRPVPTRFKDYIANPKPNGYQSLHTTVIGPYGERMEVQIRTLEMHRDAELGIAAHWKYKSGSKIDDSKDDEKFAWLRQLLEWQREIADPHEFLDAVKVDLFPDEVFVFTPRGDVINLPTDATPIDFAYAIHSDIGDHCSGARVNGKQVPLRHRLQDGDTVEISSSPNQFPRRDWLEFAVSTKARNCIRHSIRQAERERSREIGRGILESELRRRGEVLSRLEKSGELDRLAATELKRGGGVRDLYSAVAYGRLSAKDLAAKLEGASEQGEASAAGDEVTASAASVPRGLRSLFRRPKRESERPGVVVSGQSDVMVRFGGCCEPLRGEEVIGFVTRGRGVTVHAKDCPRIFELDPARRIDVQWQEDGDHLRRTRIRVTSRDRPGVLAEISRSISSAGINIGSAKITAGSGGPAVLDFELWVPGVDELGAVVKQIEKVKGVQSVERTRS
jgi:GTP pyrophosphokinase